MEFAFVFVFVKLEFIGLLMNANGASFEAFMEKHHGLIVHITSEKQYLPRRQLVVAGKRRPPSATMRGHAGGMFGSNKVHHVIMAPEIESKTKEAIGFAEVVAQILLPEDQRVIKDVTYVGHLIVNPADEIALGLEEGRPINYDVELKPTGFVMPPRDKSVLFVYSRHENPAIVQQTPQVSSRYRFSITSRMMDKIQLRFYATFPIPRVYPVHMENSLKGTEGDIIWSNEQGPNPFHFQQLRPLWGSAWIKTFDKTRTFVYYDAQPTVDMPYGRHYVRDRKHPSVIPNICPTYVTSDLQVVRIFDENPLSANKMYPDNFWVLVSYDGGSHIRKISFIQSHPGCEGLKRIVTQTVLQHHNYIRGGRVKKHSITSSKQTSFGKRGSITTVANS